MRWFGDWMDPELEELFHDDPSLQQTAQLLHAARPDAPPDVHFRNRLRAQLMQEAEHRPVRAPRRTRSVPRPLWMRLRAPHLAWGGAVLGAALIAASIFALVGQRVQDHLTPPTYNSPVSGQAFISPTEAILVSFSQPMDHASVESGLHIQPATQVTTMWNGNTLTITPVHHLTGNTPYTVTIAQPALVAASGARAAAPVQISFGTAPTPPAPSTAAVPALQPVVLGVATPGSTLLFSPDGLVVSTGATAAAPAPSASPAASPAASPVPTVSASPSLPAVVSPSATGGAAAVFNTLAFRQPPALPLVLGGRSSTAAFAPDGSALALAEPDGSGARIVISQPDGSQPRVLTRSDAAIVGLTWASPTTVEFATAGAVQSIDTAGNLKTLATPQGQPVAALAPGGSYAYLSPAASSPGSLLKVDDGSMRTLSGAGDTVTFSGDGATVAWVDASGSVPQIFSTSLAGDSTTAVSIADPGSGLAGLALSGDGSEIAYTETPAAESGGSPRLVVAQMPSGTPLATGPAASAAAFSPVDGSLALIVASASGLQVDSAQLPGSANTGESNAAATALQAFVGDQSRGDVTALRSLTGPAVDAVAATPTGLSRANIVTSLNEPDGSLAATVELIIDPSGSRASPLVADESLTLASAGAGAPYLVTALTVSSLHPLSSGPHVVHVTGSRSGSGSALLVSFDSDLDPATVPGAVTVTDAAGTVLNAVVTYDADTRTASIVLAGSPRGSLTVHVGTGLRDVNGQPLAGAFSATVRV